MDIKYDEISKLVDTIIIDAYNSKATDIHIEPEASPQTTCIRFRISGICQEYMNTSDVMAADILMRIKSMANLDISETRLPQDGFIQFCCKHVPEFDLRVTTYPTGDSKEDVVLKIITPADLIELDNLFLSEHNLTLMKNVLQNHRGLFLAVGPRLSGKTTFLHAVLAHINHPS